MNITQKQIAELRTAEKNVRKHPQLQINELKKSYEMFGQYRPLVVTSDGEILVGNGLFEALKEIGVETVDCIVLPENTPDATKKKLMLSDNKIYELGASNLGNIDEILGSLGDFEIPGYDEGVLRDLYSNSDVTEEIIDNMFILPEEKKVELNRIAMKREEEQPNLIGVAAPLDCKTAPQTNSNVEEKSGAYVTCPHCGMKIWLS